MIAALFKVAHEDPSWTGDRMTTGRAKFIHMSRIQIGMAIALALVVAITAVASLLPVNVAEAHPSGEDPLVRVSALKGEDGTVRVGVQVLGADGEWGERLFPARRVISTSAPTDTWLRSSPVTIDGGGEQKPLFCVVAHGAVDDHFWVKFRAFLYQSADLSATNLRFETHVRADDQAAAIERCVADGAAFIASSLARPDDVREPLKDAKAAGIRVITFNAGVEHAEAVGSEIHIALNDRAAGELAGQQFNERGITGEVSCLIHERDNLSLEHRCDGLEATYQGAGVTRILLDEVDSHRLHDHGDYIDALAATLTDQQGPGYDAVLALNADTLGHVLTAVHRLGGAVDGLLISSIGSNIDDLTQYSADWLDRHLGSLISDSADSQAFFVGGALQFSYNLHHDFITQPQLWLADPSLLDHQSTGGNAETFEALSASFDRILERYSEMPRAAAAGSVRVAALKRDNGSVVFAIEAKGADGRWSSRQLPQQRVLSTDAPSGRWLASSAVQVFSAAEMKPLFCIVTHGSTQDSYWQVARAFMHISAHVTDANWRYEAHLDGADQAAAISQCSADGAAVIASTLADPEAVTDSLLAAKRAGVRIVTFNSGSAFAEAAGSEIHVALDDYEAGGGAARVINEHQISGPIVCIIHEANNVGLEERCEGLEAVYRGASVGRLQLTEGASDERIIEQLLAILTAPEQSATELALVLNANTLINSLDAVSQIHAESGRTIRVVTIGSHVDVIRRTTPEVRARHRLAGFNDSVESQGFLVISAMHFVHQHPTPPELIDRPQLWLASPFAFDTARTVTDLEGLRQAVVTLYRYVAEAAADDE